jgi:putative NADH-flavin reductase
MIIIGKTGLEVIKQGVGLGHTFRALVRNRESLEKELTQEQLKNVEIIQGNVMEQADVSATVKEQDVVVNALGPRDLSSTICSSSQPLINKAIQENSSIKRIILVSSLGVNESYEGCGLLTRFFIWAIIKKAIADKCIQEDAIRKAFGSPEVSSVDYVILRPSGLMDTPKTEKIVASEGPVSGGRISRANVAWFLLKETLEGPKYSRKAVQMTT